MLASLALDVLMHLRESQDQAAARVARAVLEWPGFAPGHVTPTTIRHWRDQILAQPRNERTQFDKLRQFILAQPNPRLEIEKLLRDPPGVAKT
jgi:hypothetical protein